MQHSDDRRTCTLQALRKAQHLELMIQIQVGRWLIQQQNLSRLRQRHRDPYALTLPARKLPNATPRQSRDPCIFHRSRHGLVILTTPLTQERLVGVPPPRH